MTEILKNLMKSKKSADDQEMPGVAEMELGSGVVLKCVPVNQDVAALFVYRTESEHLPRGIVEYLMPIMPGSAHKEILQASLDQGYLRDRVIKAVQECLLDGNEKVEWHDGQIEIVKG